MRKCLWSISVVAFLSLVMATLALSWTVTEWKTKTLPIAGDVLFTSSFSAANGETITITISPANSGITISDVVLDKVTPKGCTGCSIEVSNNTGHTVDVKLTNPGPGKTFHLSLYLSTGEKLGVNVQF